MLERVAALRSRTIAHLMRVDRSHRQRRRPARGRQLADGRRPPGGRLARQRHHPAAGGGRSAALDPAISEGAAEGRRPGDAAGARRGRCSTSWRTASSARLNCLISGGTGAGKTTLLNVLSSFISDRERIATIEDAAELQLHQEHVVRLETRPPNVEGKGAIRQRQLVDQRPPHAPRPHRRRRGPRRGGARHAPGDEHRPRRIADDGSRQHAARRAGRASRR